MTDPGRRLGLAVDAARLDLGLSKQDLAKIARVGRSTVTDLINRGKVPGREVTRSPPERCLDAVMGGAQPTLRSDVCYPLSGSTKVLLEQLEQISVEARAGAAVAETLGKRLRVIGELAESAAHLAARSPR